MCITKIENKNMNVGLGLGFFLESYSCLPGSFSEEAIYNNCIQGNLYLQFNSLLCMFYQIGQNYFISDLNDLLNYILENIDTQAGS